MNLSVINFTPVVYGLILSLGIFVIWWRWNRGQYFHAIADVCVFILMMKLHGGSTDGGMSAAIAALIFDLVFLPYLLRSRPRTNG